MSLQSAVNIYNALGIPGDVAFSGPIRSQPANIDSNGSEPNVIGYAYTITAQSNPDPVGDAPNAITAQVGGTGTFAGILINSKEYASFGTTAGPLEPTLNLPDNSLGELMFMGEVYVEIPGAAVIGDLVYYDNTTGALGTVSPNVTGEMSQSTTTVTVEASPAPTGNIGVGTILRPTGADAVRVIALGSGTGADGTYIVDVSQSVSANTAFTGNSVAPSGKTLVPNGAISRFPAASVSPTGLAVLKMTN